MNKHELTVDIEFEFPLNNPSRGRRQELPDEVQKPLSTPIAGLTLPEGILLDWNSPPRGGVAQLVRATVS